MPPTGPAAPGSGSFAARRTSDQSRGPHRDADAALVGDLERALVAGIGVADDAHAGIGGQDALQARGGLGRSVGDDHHAGVERVADADAAAVVEADPGGAGGGVDEGVEDRPVGDRVRAVAHRLGLAVRADATEPASRWSRPMTIGALISPDATSSLMRGAGLRPLAVAEPADARRQPLDRHLLGGQAQPALEPGVVGEELGQRGVDARDVGGVAGQRRHPERSPALAEERPDEGGHEAGEVERVLHAGLLARARMLLP